MPSGSSSPPSPRIIPRAGCPRISAAYVLFDAATLRPTHLLDGVALTNLRTPAVSVAAVLPWLDLIDEPLRVVAFGGGPQGLGHLETIAAVHPVATSAVVVRQPDRVELPESLCRTQVLAADDPGVARLLGEAHLVACATTARTPLFDSRLLGDRAIVVAVGSHEADAREVDAAFCARACVIVEDRQTALRECGDVIQAIAEGALDPDDLVPSGMSRAGPGRPRKSQSSSRGRACPGRTWSSPRPCWPGSERTAMARAQCHTRPLRSIVRAHGSFDDPGHHPIGREPGGWVRRWWDVERTRRRRHRRKRSWNRTRGRRTTPATAPGWRPSRDGRDDG